MNREQEYRHLANNVFQRASEEGFLLKAQWEILGAQYLELADQSKKIDDENDSFTG